MLWWLVIRNAKIAYRLARNPPLLFWSSSKLPPTAPPPSRFPFPFRNSLSFQHGPNEQPQHSRRADRIALGGTAQTKEEESAVDGKVRVGEKLHEEHHLQQLYREGYEETGGHH